MKSAKKFANQLNLDVDYDIAKKTTTIRSSEGQIKVTKCQLRITIKSIVKKEMEQNFEEKVKQQPWVGQYIVNRWQDEDVEKESYNISKIWRGIPDVFYST